MSGAEAILVLGVISSVIAIVDGTKQVYDAAANAEGLPEAFREVANRLPIVRNTLESAKQHIDGGKVDEASCKAMVPVVKGCEKKAETLDSLFQKVLPPDDASRMKRYTKAARTLGKGGRVEDLMKGILEDVQLLAGNHLIKFIMPDQNEQLAEAIKHLSEMEPSLPEDMFQEGSFTSIMYGDGTMTNYHVRGDQYTQTNNGPGKSFQGDGMVFNFENYQGKEQSFQANIQNFITSRSLDETAARKAVENELLNLLEFEGMNERYDDIPQAHKQTFRWIYEKPELRFVEWLKGGKGVYWITGKAGSGKSTLMKYLYEHPSTFNHLPVDSQNTLIAGFFFHDRGENALLKSQAGLFRAILHRILTNYPQLVSIALPEYFKGKMELPNRLSWPLAKLKKAFKQIAAQQLVNLRLCLLIDGLDEFSGDDREIIDSLSDLLPQSTNCMVRIQLCLSSRPEMIFEKAYSRYWHLKMEELTEGDISIYVTAKFNEVDELRDLVEKDSVTSIQIKEEILSKAEGLFLWVTLVVSSLIEGLEFGDNMKTLQRRLSVLPSGLKPLFKRMIEEISPFYHEDAVLLFEMVQCASLPLSPLAVYFADEQPKRALLDEANLSDSEIRDRHFIVAKRLKARSAGLIEMTSISQAQEDTNTSEEGNTIWIPCKVQYLHLTVKEFFVSGDLPAWLSIQKSKMLFDPHVQIVASYLRQFRVTGSLNLYDYTDIHKGALGVGSYHKATTGGIIFMLMSHAVQAERSTHSSQLAYLDELDKVINHFGSLSREELDFRHEHPQWHWTLGRYGDWSESEDSQSDYLSYLVTIGMTRTVINKFESGYMASQKPGRPLLLYATVTMAPDYAIGNMERDAVDPMMIEALLQRNCDPNQFFLSQHVFHGRDYGERTVWESVLLYLWKRFCTPYHNTEDSRIYQEELENNDREMRDLKIRWLKIFKLFIDHGADTTTFVSEGSRRRREFGKDDRSAFKIFKMVFSDVDHPLVITTRNLIISKGAEKREKDFLVPVTDKGIRKSVPFINKALKKLRLNRA